MTRVRWVRAATAGHAGPVARSMRRRRSGPSAPDRGGATVLACVALAGLIVVTLLIGQLGAVVIVRHQVQSAADLGALAGAGALDQGADAGCAAAGELVRRTKFQMEGCVVTDWDAAITVIGKVPIGLFGERTVRAVARAGPIGDAEAAIRNR